MVSSDQYVRSTSGETSVSQHVSTAASPASSEPQISSKDSSTSSSACRTLPERCHNSPNWSTFNSLIHDKTPVWNVGIVAPLYTRSPTEWPVLLTVLKYAQKLNFINVGKWQRPIITLDGDLYDCAVKLKDYNENWCIRFGGLHITMAALKCLGKYIEGSGIDLTWEEAGIYGSVTVRQILNGCHIYRCIEAHIVTLIALFTMCIQVIFSEDEKTFLEQFKSQVAEMHQTLSAYNCFERLNEWKEQTKGISNFLTNYMNQVEVLLNAYCCYKDLPLGTSYG